MYQASGVSLSRACFPSDLISSVILEVWLKECVESGVWERNHLNTSCAKGKEQPCETHERSGVFVSWGCVPSELLMCSFKLHSKYQNEPKNNAPGDQPIYIYITMLFRLLHLLCFALRCHEISGCDPLYRPFFSPSLLPAMLWLLLE